MVHMARTGRREIVQYTVVMGKPERKNQLAELGVMERYYYTASKETCLVDRIKLAQDRNMWRTLMNRVIEFRII